jgi:hypothetical protein
LQSAAIAAMLLKIFSPYGFVHAIALYCLLVYRDSNGLILKSLSGMGRSQIVISFGDSFDLMTVGIGC